MAILTNQGRTVPELPSLNATTIGTYDLLIIQNIQSNSTKQSTISEFVKKSAELFTGFNGLKFTGPNNQYTGSIRNVDTDSYSVVTQGVPNILKRLEVTDYVKIGYNLGAPTTFNVYAKNITFDQGTGGGGNITFIGNYTTSTYFIQDYSSGVYLINSPLIGENITALTGFTGDLTGNVTGNLAGNVTSTGTSTFFNINVNNNLYSANAQIDYITTLAGQINNTIIGNIDPDDITGETITANTRFLGRLTGSVLGNIKGDVDANTVNVSSTVVSPLIIGDLSGNVTGDVSGDVNGDLTGDIKSPTGNIVLQNGPGAVNQALFYGTSSYSKNGNNFSSFSSSYAFTSSFSKHAFTASYSLNNQSLNSKTASYLDWSNVRSNGTSSYSFNGLGKYSSYSSSYSFSSSYAVNSNYSKSTISSSYALSSSCVTSIVDNAKNSLVSTFAYTSDTASYLSRHVSDPYKFTYFDNTRLINSPYFSYQYASGYDIYYMSSSHPAGYLIIDSLANNAGFAESGLILSNNYNRKSRVPSYNWGPEGWRFFVGGSGSLSLSSLTGSYQFTNENFTAKGVEPFFSSLVVRNNVFYFWPGPNSYNTINRDASIGIGVSPPSSASMAQRTKAKLHISVFSSSVSNLGKGAWPGQGTVRKLDGAILVEYGSGSLNSALTKTFYVSGSGNMYTAGNLYVNKGITGSIQGTPYRVYKGSSISFWGTGSNSVSGSYALRSTSGSFARNSLSSSYISTGVATFVNSVSATSYVDTPSSSGTDYTNVVVTVPPNRRIKHFKICGTVFNSAGCTFNLNGVKINGTLVQTDVYCSLGWGAAIILPPNTSLPFTIDGDPPANRQTGNLTFTLNWSTTRVGDTSIKIYVVGYY